MTTHQAYRVAVDGGDYVTVTAPDEEFAARLAVALHAGTHGGAAGSILSTHVIRPAVRKPRRVRMHMWTITIRLGADMGGGRV